MPASSYSPPFAKRDPGVDRATPGKIEFKPYNPFPRGLIWKKERNAPAQA